MTEAVDAGATIATFLSRASACEARGETAMTLAYQVSAALPGHRDAGWSVASAVGDSGEDDALVVVLRRGYAMSVKRAAGHGELEARRRLVGLYEFGQPGLAPEPEAILRILIEDATGHDVRPA